MGIELEQGKTPFEHEIKSISVFENLNQIYTIYFCLSGKNKIIIYGFNLNAEIFAKKKEEITKTVNSNFRKAIQLSNDMIATADYGRIIDIWLKDKDSFLHISQINVESDISDILPVNKECFISSHEKSSKINFYDIKSLSIEKTLSKIGCSFKINSLFLFNNKIIIVLCFKGFCIISIKTKEVIQYIEDYDEKHYYNRDFCLKTNQKICVFYVYKIDREFDEESDEDESEKNEKMNMYVIKPTEIGLQVVETYENINIKKNLKLICINNEDTIFWNKYIGLLDE